MSAFRTLFLAFFTIIFTSNLFSQDITIDVFVHNHKTYAPLDSALVKVLHDGAILTSSYTGVDGWAQLTITPTGVKEMISGLPNIFVVSENYPNPFMDETHVDFSIPESQTVRADIYNVLGQQLLADEFALSAGNYTLKVPFSNLPTGIYFLRLRGMEQKVVKLMKAGEVMHHERGISGRNIMQVIPGGGVSLPLQKGAAETQEFTIEVKKNRYETWSAKKQIEYDIEITVPLVMSTEYLLTDIDGNVYQTVQIGDQLWMAENLRVTRYRNGDAIPTNLDNTQWANTTSGAYAIYPYTDVHGINSDEEMVDAYGKLYNWYAVDDERGLCPEDWHIPSDDDWKQLEMYLGMSQQEADNTGWRGTDAGGSLKSIRNTPSSHPRWDIPNEGATNESGWSGLPGGFRNNSGEYVYLGSFGYWWLSTREASGAAWSRYLYYDYSNVFRISSFVLVDGRSVRCLIPSETIVYSISGTVTKGDTALAGVTITVSGDYPDTTQTDSNGFYSIFGIPHGSNITITASLEGYSFSPPNRTISDINFNQTNQNFSGIKEGDVFNPATGKTWMDRNLGASRAATSSTDAQAYGHLYQWGRPADGHQVRTSGTTSTRSSSDTPGHGNFILAPDSPYDWRSPQNDNLWQEINGTNNPCPSGYRLPTEAEWEAERESWSSNNAAGAFSSPLKLPAAGLRSRSNGSLYDVGSGGFYWSSTVDGTNSRLLGIYSNYANMHSFGRAHGGSVRCITYTDTFIISGRVTVGGKGLGGVIIMASGGYSQAVMTNSNGDFTIIGVPHGANITINPSLVGYNFTPSNRTINNISSNHTDNNFEASREYEPGEVSDIDGNTYTTVKIGNQWWMAENLRTTRYRNGDTMITKLSYTEWQNTKSGSYAIYPHDGVPGIDSDDEMVEAYGKLYNWYAVEDERGLCPQGWRVPSDGDWTALVNYVVAQGYPNQWDNPNRIAGNALKSRRQVNSPLGAPWATSEHPRWNFHDTHHGLDVFGFSGLPGGYRLANGYSSNVGIYGYWWSSTEGSTGSAWFRYLVHDNGYVGRYGGNKQDGFSVRCLRDD